MTTTTTLNYSLRTLNIELLAIDLSTCSRCTGSLSNIEQAIARELAILVSGMKSRVQRGQQKFKELLQTCSQLQMDAVDNVIEYEMKDVQICRSCGLAK
ncbi:hypothetical protein CEN50_04340 [Fischerella thermalis CCMEE 5268]|uniref:Uncharacterized protein n=1 Tax=Fischerella thermalis CCMEE 5268 TaxID=2019662 RepID=A0A2N6KKG2_9CYAN|nr:hypothetical protein [Fischerella thermalis]PMB00161.1 hypothetical protein CEN50_04340 [Fischerella thermalis CCMEE 5268]